MLYIISDNPPVTHIGRRRTASILYTRFTARAGESQQQSDTLTVSQKHIQLNVRVSELCIFIWGGNHNITQSNTTPHSDIHNLSIYRACSVFVGRVCCGLSSSSGSVLLTSLSFTQKAPTVKKSFKQKLFMFFRTLQNRCATTHIHGQG